MCDADLIAAFLANGGKVTRVAEGQTGAYSELSRATRDILAGREPDSMIVFEVYATGEDGGEYMETIRAPHKRSAEELFRRAHPESRINVIAYAGERDMALYREAMEY